MRKVSIGKQDYESLITSGCFYVDKTYFIKEWWESQDDVTLITRPRRFGKTLNMSMLECFFSNKYAGRGDLFEGLSIWNDEKYRQLQGFFQHIYYDRAFNCHTIDEAVFYFAFSNGLTYQKSLNIIKKINEADAPAATNSPSYQ